jgi:hypothetical protein
LLRAAQIKPFSFVTRATRQGRNYSALVGWLLYTASKGSVSKLTAAAGFSLAHLASQAAAIYAIYWYGRQMESNGNVAVPLLKLTVNFKDQPEWLWAIVIFSTVAFVISATFLYVARRQILDVVEKHYARAIEGLALLSSRLPDPRARLASDLFMKYGTGGLGMGCRRSAIIVITFFNAIMAAVSGVVAATFLIWIDPSLTLLILVSAGLAVLLLYPLTLRAVQGAKDREKAQAAFRKEVHGLGQKGPMEQAVANFSSVGELARAYMMQRRVLTELIFATEIGITIIIGLVVYYMASEALAGREQWAIFIAYIAALRTTLSGAAQPIRAFASVSRYYLQIVRYSSFTKDVQRIDETCLAQPQPGDTLILGILPNGKDVVVEAGNCLALATFEPLRHIQYTLLNARLRHVAAPLAATAVDSGAEVGANVAIAILNSNQFGASANEVLKKLKDELENKVTLIVYQHANKVGAFGEEHVLTLFDGSFQRFAALGTEEGDAALKEFSLKAADKRRSRSGVVDYDDDEEDDDL